QPPAAMAAPASDSAPDDAPIAPEGAVPDEPVTESEESGIVPEFPVTPETFDPPAETTGEPPADTDQTADDASGDESGPTPPPPGLH
ncbi:MAG: hypothetical protein VYC34_00345, partial [Planctomycetota bacterium]|nr:hypothetical protein [Planctomycetota bacterium]